MGLSYSTARLIAPASFLYDFAAQQYGLNSTPNMKDVNDANVSFWSPQPYFIGAFFFPQQFFQLAWLYKLYKMSGKVKDGSASAQEKAEVDEMVQFVPYYVIGNICIGSKFCIYREGAALIVMQLGCSSGMPPCWKPPMYLSGSTL